MIDAVIATIAFTFAFLTVLEYLALSSLHRRHRYLDHAAFPDFGRGE